MGDRRVVCMVLVGEPKGKKLLGRPRRKWEEILKYTFKKLD
jgi:hypothetical protein